jgi:all-trans-retinol 13,14-reductase
LLAENIEELGGEIYTEAEVSEFLFKEKELVGVKTKDGRDIYGKQFISNMHPALTLEKIAEGKIRKSFRHRLENIPNTISVFGLHIRLKPGKVLYKNYNYHFYKENDVWAVNSYSKNKLPSFYYLYFPTGKNEDKFADCVSVYTYMHFDEVKKWESLPPENRGKEYENWKKLKAAALLDLVSEKFPLIKENTLEWLASTPLTYSDYIGSPDGAMYGTLRDYHNPMSSYIFAKTKIPNLFFTGQNNNLHGMLGVTISALVTCGEIVGLEKLINEVNEQ